MLTSDGVDIGHVDQVLRRAGSPTCLILSLHRKTRSAPADVVVTSADVTVGSGVVRLRHVAHADLGQTGVEGRRD